MSCSQNEDLTTNEWLVKATEIKRRRLIRRTARHNVYRADWFGDVLVYEPNEPSRRMSNRSMSWSAHKRPQMAPTRNEGPPSGSRSLELELKLSKLTVRDPPDHPEQPESPVGVASPSWSSSSSCGYESGGDSAYNSISSTPQFSRTSQFQFEFPPQKPSMVDCGAETIQINSRESPKQQETAVASSSDFRLDVYCGHFRGSCDSDSVEQFVGLDGASFGDDSNEQQQQQQRHQEMEHTSQQELTSLRLVAHEGFLLFLGVSPASDQQANAASLVMQAAHPEAVSLANLIHGSARSGAPASQQLNRFFPLATSSQLWPLDNRAKLDICKQVINAMTYLHDKNMVHSKLTSVNIYLEPNQRVKISLIDDEQSAPIDTCSCSPATCAQHRQHLLSLPALTYMGPELIQYPESSETTQLNCYNTQATSSLGNKHQFYFNTQALDKQSDVYSLGTLLFELFEERLPFSNPTNCSPRSSPSRLEMIDALRSAHSPSLYNNNNNNSPSWTGNIKHTPSQLVDLIKSGTIFENNPTSARCPNLIRYLIKGCWSADPSARPTFKQLNLVMRWQQQ